MTKRKSRAKPRMGWLEFEEQFRIEFPNFVHDLSKRFPELTPTEVQICAMILRNLESLEIRDILGIEEHTVENHRWEIRRKLKLTKAQNLNTYLNSI